MSLFPGTLLFCVASSLRLGFEGERVLFRVQFEIWPRHFQFQTHQSSFSRLSKCLLFLVSNQSSVFLVPQCWVGSVSSRAFQRAIAHAYLSSFGQLF
jgi:hypothetical protein